MKNSSSYTVSSTNTSEYSLKLGTDRAHYIKIWKYLDSATTYVSFNTLKPMCLEFLSCLVNQNRLYTSKIIFNS